MSSFVRTLQKRMMKRAGLHKITLPVLSVVDGKVRELGTRRAVVDNEEVEYGESYPRSIPEQFRVPSNPKAKDLLARLVREARRVAVRPALA